MCSIMICCILICTGCTSSAYLNNSSKKADIEVKDNAFDVTLDKCIDILNNDLKKEGLSLIPKEYEISEYDNWDFYKSKINSHLAIRFTKPKKDRDCIELIELIQLDNYKQQEEKIDYQASKEDTDLSVQYYRIICDNIAPQFDSKQFVKDAGGNNKEFELDGLVFNVDNVFSDDVYYNEEVNLYKVLSNKELFHKYENELWDDDNLFFH